MVTKEQIQRINELSKKQRSIGLTDEEKQEQEHLRKLYISSIRENLKSQLDNIKVVSPEEYEKLNGERTSKCSCGHDHNHNHSHSNSCGCGHEHHKCDCKEHKN